MAIEQSDEQIHQQPLRLWPGVVIVLLQWLLRFAVPVVVPGAVSFGLLGGVLGGLAVVLWWAFFSRAPRSERWGAVVVMIAALVATPLFLHESIASAMLGLLFPFYAIPVLSLAFVAWAVASRRLSAGPRRAAMVATILLACGAWALVRTQGVGGGFDWDFAWRWAETPEERLLAQAGDEPTVVPSPPAAATTGADWPGFRGPGRDAVVRGVQIATDWSQSPPVELWRRPIGPGWSSFAVRGGLLYTQEQRGRDEVVACYNAPTGEPVWKHRDATRFWEAMAGAGPRATPTVSEGRVFALGATGILNVLDAGTGSVVWSRNVVSDTGAEVPLYGFASSPLVTSGVVIVAAAGQLVAYDLATGDPRWFGPSGGESDRSRFFESYSSPHLLTIDGVPQALLMTGDGVTSVAPADGTLLWEHPWPGLQTLQPALIGGGDLLISNSGSSRGIGMRRLRVAHGAAGWTVEERWTSIGLKPYFNDFVVHEGYAFGFDGRILACIELDGGERKWKGGRYGPGQLVLLPEQDLLLVVSERGELVLVAAIPERFTELARFPALEGKTWNHPVLVGDVLLVRNSQEMAAFRLSLAAGTRVAGSGLR